LVGGGDPPSFTTTLLAEQKKKYLYTPNYIPANESDRPVLTLATPQTSTVFYDEPVPAYFNHLNVRGNGLQRVVAVSLGSMTHAFDMGQRAYRMSVETSPILGEELRASASSMSFGTRMNTIFGMTFRDPWYMPPGWYMVFAQDTGGRMSRAQIIRLVERYSIDLPSEFQTQASNGSWNAAQTATQLIHGDMVYGPVQPASNADFGGINAGSPTTISIAASAVQLTSNTGTPTRIRIRNWVPSLVSGTNGRLLRIKMEVQTNVDGFAPEFAVRTDASTFQAATIISPVLNDAFRQFSRLERYREFVIQVPANVTPFRNLNGEIEVEVTFPGSTNTIVDMAQIGAYQNSVPY
jgi:hypothetical protein